MEIRITESEFRFLEEGDFGLVFARPETGKTTFLASEVTAMAGQLTEEDGPILWLKNEEMSRKVLRRCYQAALGMPKQQLDQGNSAEIMKKFREVTSNKLLIPELRTTSRREMEYIIHKEKPRLVLIDQIDNVTGFKADRRDLELGENYKWARHLADECPVIAVCQADVTGENQKWLYMNNVANAKTEKQGAADFIIGIGKIHDQGYEYIRFINISKNKLDITIMKMDAGLDTGPMLSVAREAIRPDDTTASLSERMSYLGAQLMADTLTKYLAGEIVPQPQPADGATYSPKIDKADAQIDWRKPAIEIERMVRAYLPWPGTQTMWDGQMVKVLKAGISPTGALRGDQGSGLRDQRSPRSRSLLP